MSPSTRQLAPHSPHPHSLARRALAFAGLLYLITLLSLPIFLPAQDAKLPACCRRAGAHHCAMNSMAPTPAPFSDSASNSASASAAASDSASTAAAAITAVSHCPSWPRAFAAPHSQAFAPQPSAGISAALLSAATLRTRNHALARIARLRQLSLRGPPPAPLA